MQKNPKDIIGSNKIPLHLWPPSASALGSMAMLDGALKYGRNNFREMSIQASEYIAACKRHLDAWFEGENCAADSQLPHLAHALACIAIVLDAQCSGALIDDRNLSGEGYLALVRELTPVVARIRETHKDKNPKHYSLLTNNEQEESNCEEESRNLRHEER